MCIYIYDVCMYVYMYVCMYIYIYVLIICGLIIDPHNDQLPIGFIAEMVELCPGNTEIRVSYTFISIQMNVVHSRPLCSS